MDARYPVPQPVPPGSTNSRIYVVTAATVTPPVSLQLGVAIPGYSNEGMQIRGIVQPPPEQAASTLLSGLVPAPPPAPSLFGVAIQGSTNQWGVAEAAPQPEAITVDLLSRGFVYFPSAPPIYRVITQGGNNQGFSFEAVPQPDPILARLGSRWNYLPLPVTVFQVPPLLGVMLAGGTNQGGVVRGYPRDPYPPGLLSRPFYKLQAAVVVSTARHRTLMGVGQ